MVNLALVPYMQLIHIMPEVIDNDEQDNEGNDVVTLHDKEGKWDFIEHYELFLERPDWSGYRRPHGMCIHPQHAEQIAELLRHYIDGEPIRLKEAS